MARSSIHQLIVVLFLLLAYQPMTMANNQPRHDLAEIRSAAKSFIRHQHRGDPGTPKIYVADLDPRLRLHHCEKKLQAFMPPGSRKLGNTSIGIRCSGPKPWKLYVPVRIKMMGHVLISANYLPKGTVVRSADLKRVDFDLASLRQGYFTMANQITGKMLKQAIPLGRIITPAYLSKPKLVRRGENVIILAKTSGFEIRMKGKALMDGTAGELIRVKNIKSHRIVEGTVERSGIIQVPF